MIKVIKWLFVALGGLFILTVAAAIIGYFLLNTVNTHDYAYAASPDKDLVATVKADPATFRFLVYVKNRNEIISFNEQVAYLSDVSDSECNRKIEVEWRSNNHLIIKFNDAKVVDVPKSKVRIGGRIITVQAVFNGLNTTAPCGSPSLQLMNKGGGS